MRLLDASFIPSIPGCLMFPLLFGVGAAMSARAAPLSAEDVVAAALTSHPDAVLGRTDIDRAVGARRAAATLLADPEVQVGLSVVGDLTFLQAQQPLSLSGEGQAARREARASLDAARGRSDWTALEVAAAARQAWLDAAVADRRATLALQALEQARRLRAAVEERASAGDLAPLDVALARAREAEVTARLLESRDNRAHALTALTRYHPDAWQAELIGDPADAVPEGRGGHRADLDAARAEVLAARSGLSRARAAGLPPLGIGVQAQSDGGQVDLGPMFTVAVPLWTRNPDGVADARAALAVAEAREATLTAQVDASTALGRSSAEAARRDLAGLQGAREAVLAGLSALDAAFLAGELDVRELVFTHRELVDGLLAVLDAERTAADLALEALLAEGDVALLGGAR